MICGTDLIGQLLNGLSYIVSQNLQHTDLDCSGILMDTDGNIKIGMRNLYSYSETLF